MENAIEDFSLRLLRTVKVDSIDLDGPIVWCHIRQRHRRASNHFSSDGDRFSSSDARSAYRTRPSIETEPGGCPTLLRSLFD